jgi:hypothetical protein
VVTKRIEGTKSYMRVRKADLDARFPGLIDSILNADAVPHGQRSSRVSAWRVAGDAGGSAE